MQPDHNHITDEEILLEADGEISGARASAIRDHLARCWSCRTRKAELERAIADFVQVHRRGFDGRMPPIHGPRALFRARLVEAAAEEPTKHWARRLELFVPERRWAWSGAIILLIAFGGLLAWLPIHDMARHNDDEFEPNSAWTPGATRNLSPEAVCSASASAQLQPLTVAVAQDVFHEYGIWDPRPRSYEVDYLIPPALGGSGDRRNLWPQPYYSAGVWNARVKDALEDHLRSLVCDGKLDLATAQRDLARDWIAAYKKYFHTRQPLLVHVAFVKDHPWE